MILITTLLLLPVLLICWALVVDVAYHHIIKQDMYNITQAVSHAAAISHLQQEHKSNWESIARSHTVFGKSVQPTDILVEKGHWDRDKHLFKKQKPYNAIRASYHLQDSYFFPSLMGQTSFEVSSHSIVHMGLMPKTIRLVDQT